MIESTRAFQQFANGKSWQQLNFQTQQQIRLMAILEQANQKYGDTIANTTIARQNQLLAQLKNVKLSLGQAFQPIYNYILPALIRFATALATVVNYIAQFTTALFGGSAKAQKAQANATNAQAGAVSGLGDAYKDAGNQAKAAGKKAKGAAASFDQLNLIGKNGADAGAGSDASGGVDVSAGMNDGLLGDVGNGMVEVSKKAQEMADKVRAAFERMKDFVVRNKDIIIAATVGIAAAFGGMWLAANGGAMAKGAMETFKRIAALATPINLVAAAVAAIVGAATLLYQKWDDLDWKWRAAGVALLGSAGLIVLALKTVEEHWDDIAAAVNNIWQSTFVPFGNWIAGAFKTAWEVVTEAAGWLWKNVLVPFGEFLTSFKKGVLDPLGAVLVDALGMGFEFVSDVAKDFWKTVLVPFGNFLSSTFSEAVQAVSDIFNVWWNNVLKPLGSWIKTNFEPLFKSLGDAITYVWQNVLRPFGDFMIGNFKTIFHSVFQTIGDLIGDMKTTFSGLINFIAGVFTGDWQRAWNGVKDIFKGVFGGLYDIVKTPLNLIIDALNKLIDGLNNLDIDLPDWMGGQSFGLNIKKIPRLARGGLAYGPTLAMVGDNRGAVADPEVIAPLSKLESIMGGGDTQVVNVLNSILRAVQSGQNVNVTISQREVFNAAVGGIKDHQRRTGALPFPV